MYIYFVFSAKNTMWRQLYACYNCNYTNRVCRTYSIPVAIMHLIMTIDDDRLHGNSMRRKKTKHNTFNHHLCADGLLFSAK